MKLRDNIKGVQHLGIPVVQMEETRKFYIENFGFKVIHEKEIFYPEKMKICFLQLGDLVVELFEHKSEAIRREVESRVTGVYDHFAIDAADFDDYAAKLINKGLTLAPGTADGVVLYDNIKTKGIRGVNFVSPNGDVVEICYDNARSYAGKSGLLGWDHLAVRTKNIKESMSFYAELGFSMTGNGYLNTPEGRLYIAFMTCKGFTLELIQLVGAAAEDPDTWKTGKIDHIALDVENAQDALVEARSCGYNVIDFGLKELPLFEHGCRFFSIKGPSGEIIEFNQKNKF